MRAVFTVCARDNSGAHVGRCEHWFACVHDCMVYCGHGWFLALYGAGDCSRFVVLILKDVGYGWLE